jgi:beta-glucosidase
MDPEMVTELLPSASGAAPPVRALVRQLGLEAKARLLTGATAWRLHALPEIGLRSLVVSDGPVGVRGTGETPGERSLLFPSPSALAATWDTGTAAALGALFAREARAHGVDVVLAPQINIQRTPVAGRHFECYSEDPLLTGVMAAALIAAMQAGGVAAVPKHYVANNSETARTEYVARIDEQTLHEVYLAPFERAVVDGGAWVVMSAYNGVDDTVTSAPMSEHGRLVDGVLRRAWGFDGVVVSEPLAARRTVESALGGLDLVMPGPGGPWEHHLVAAVRDGRVPEALIDRKVARLLHLAQRVGALEPAGDGVRRLDGDARQRTGDGAFDPAGGSARQRTGDGAVDPAGDGALPQHAGDLGFEPAGDGYRTATAGAAGDRAFLRALAARAMVMLRRGQRFPIDPAGLRRVALIGPNAVAAHMLGGGSSSVAPERVVSPVEGLRSALAGVEIDLRRGGDTRRHAPAVDVATSCCDPRSGQRGIRLRHLDALGGVLHDEVVSAWDGWVRDLLDAVDTVVIDALLDLRAPGDHRIEVGTVGRYRVDVDGVTVARAERDVGAEVILDSSINAPDGVGTLLTVAAPRRVRLTAELGVVRAAAYGNIVRGELRHRAPGPTIADEVAAAVDCARRADRVVVVVGTNDEVESEGWDRTDLRLPGRQDELVEQVLDVAPDAIVVVNAGAPLVLPWLDRAATVLWSWFPVPTPISSRARRVRRAPRRRRERWAMRRPAWCRLRRAAGSIRAARTPHRCAGPPRRRCSTSAGGGRRPVGATPTTASPTARYSTSPPEAQPNVCRVFHGTRLHDVVVRRRSRRSAACFMEPGSMMLLSGGAAEGLPRVSWNQAP